MEIVETNRLLMRRLMPEDYKVMAAWDMELVGLRENVQKKMLVVQVL